MTKNKRLVLLVILMTIILAGCFRTEADSVSYSLSKSADTFEVQRKVIFLNGITDNHLFTIEGLCALDIRASERTLTVTCKTGDEEYKKHYLGLSDNISYFVEQTDAKHEDPFHYKVIFRPESLIPDIDIQTSKEK